MLRVQRGGDEAARPPEPRRGLGLPTRVDAVLEHRALRVGQALGLTRGDQRLIPTDPPRLQQLRVSGDGGRGCAANQTRCSAHPGEHPNANRACSVATRSGTWANPRSVGSSTFTTGSGADMASSADSFCAWSQESCASHADTMSARVAAPRSRGSTDFSARIASAPGSTRPASTSQTVGAAAGGRTGRSRRRGSPAPQPPALCRTCV